MEMHVTGIKPSAAGWRLSCGLQSRLIPYFPASRGCLPSLSPGPSQHRSNLSFCCHTQFPLRSFLPFFKDPWNDIGPPLRSQSRVISPSRGLYLTHICKVLFPTPGHPVTGWGVRMWTPWSHPSSSHFLPAGVHTKASESKTELPGGLTAAHGPVFLLVSVTELSRLEEVGSDPQTHRTLLNKLGCQLIPFQVALFLPSRAAWCLAACVA